MTISYNPSTAEIREALADPDPANPLAQAIAHAIDAYVRAIACHISENDTLEGTITVPAPTTEIEAYALQAVIGEFTSSGFKVKVKGDS